MSETKRFTLKELAKLTDSIVIGDETIVIDNISAIDKSNKTSISFLANKKYEKVRGERTPMPPRGNKRREEFERWYAANVR